MNGKRICALVLCLLLPLGAMAEGLEMAAPITGEQLYPQGTSADTAVYTFRYAYPQFVAQMEADAAINAYYQSLCEDLKAIGTPEVTQEMLDAQEPGMPPMYTEILYRVTAMTDAYVSVCLTKKQFLGYVESENLTANVFARDGMYAGQVVQLSQVMGMEQEGDEFSAQASYASQLVYKLVWQIIVEQRASLQRDYFDGLTQKDVEAVFSPETDFYMDADGNLVFYIQPGMIAGDVEGLLMFPFSQAELLTAVKQ